MDKPFQILVVEDDPIFNLDLVATFEAAGFKVCQTNSTIEAREILHKNSIDGVSCDNNLEIDGAGAVLMQELRSSYPHIKTVMVTGNPPPNIAEIADAYFEKPCFPGQVVAQMKALLTKEFA